MSELKAEAQETAPQRDKNEGIPTNHRRTDTVRTMVSRRSGMARFIGVVLLLHIPLFFYPILRLADWLNAAWPGTIFFLLLFGSSQMISRFYLRHRREAWAKAYRLLADTWLGLSPILLMSLLVFEGIVKLSGLDPETAAWWVIYITLATGIVGTAFALFPVVKTIRLSSTKLSEPVRFVQLTDVHIGSRSKRFLEQVVSTVNRLEPDFVCITGDFIDATGVPERDLRSLRSIVGPVYFSIGNHEKYEDLDDILVRLENQGVQVLRNETTLDPRGFQVIGVDDMDDAMQVERQLSRLTVDSHQFVLLLYHRPRGLEAAARHGVDLMISGHTHNGQIVPFNLVVNRVFEKVKGLYQEGKTYLYVSQGTGTWGPIMRVGTRSEITLFEITPAA